MSRKHVHTYELKRPTWYGLFVPRCTVCKRTEKPENLVYLGEAPRSVGPGYLGSVTGR